MCNRCTKVNNGYKFCEECGIEFRIDRKERKQVVEQEIFTAQVVQEPK
jgi:hypothetical protein